VAQFTNVSKPKQLHRADLTFDEASNCWEKIEANFQANTFLLIVIVQPDTFSVLPTNLVLLPGLPDGIFSNQKSQFG
jgi:hypothetical protein